MTITSGTSGSGALLPTVNHELHREHNLILVNTDAFQCDVCKQYGEGSQHYRCVPCDFDAHAYCATAPATFKHVNYAGDFVLYSGSGSGDPERYCGMCGREVLGYRYYNRQEKCRLHPCCAFLPKRVVQDCRAFELGYHPSDMCGMCGTKSTAWLSYRSSYDDGEEVYLHVPCLVDTNNRWTGYQDWVASAPIRPGVLGSFTRKKEGDLNMVGRDGVHRSKRGDVLKVAKTSFSVVRFVLHAATFDFAGAAEAAQDVREAFSSD